jgi:hypothetical protein
MKYLIINSILVFMVCNAQAQITEYCKNEGLASNQVCVHAAAGSEDPYDCSSTYLEAEKLAFRKAFEFCNGHAKLLGNRWRAHYCSTPTMNGRPVGGSGYQLYGIFECI